MREVMGEVRSAIARGDLSGLDLSGESEEVQEVLKDYLRRVPMDILMTGVVVVTGHATTYTLQPLYLGGTFYVCGMVWLRMLDGDARKAGKPWAIGMARDVIHHWEDWAKTHTPGILSVVRDALNSLGHPDAVKICAEEAWGVTQGNVSQDAHAFAASAHYSAWCAHEALLGNPLSTSASATEAVIYSRAIRLPITECRNSQLRRRAHKRVQLDSWKRYMLVHHEGCHA